ncbi:transposable element Tc1 transposase [Trichonephila clavipes]|nr:transposable element Tc1 transposase [Trichonephila clavipes]
MSIVVVDHIVEDTSVCDAALRVAATMIFELRVLTAAKIIELYAQKLPKFLTQEDSRRLRFVKTSCCKTYQKADIHWCAKIKDEVEKLAYQLNEEAERTERPIRRLSKVMYGSTCADMQVDVMGECLSSIKHVVGEQLSGDSVVVVHEEPHPQMTGTLSYRPEETGGRQREKSLDTRHRLLDDRYRVLPFPEDCTVVVCLHYALYGAHRRRRSLWCREHRNWRDNEWGRVLFTDESRFSLSSDSHRILIWRERGSRNHPSNIIERDRYGGRVVLVWGSIMLGSRTDLHIFDAGSVNGTPYCNEILLPYVRLFRGAMGLRFLFMDDNAPCHRTVAAEQL